MNTSEIGTRIGVVAMAILLLAVLAACSYFATTGTID